MPWFKQMLSTGIFAICIPAFAAPAYSDNAMSADIFSKAGFFVSVNAGASLRGGSTSTTNGGTASGGGGISRDVDFGSAYVVGIVLGRQVTPEWSYFISYDHIDGNVNFKVDFPAIPAVGQNYAGRATSEMVLANIAYSVMLQETSRLRFSVGAGVSFNRFHNIIETDSVPGAFFAPLSGGNTANFAARIAVGYEHDLTENLSFDISAGADYYGSFETGSSRDPNGLGVIQPITKFELDDVWGATISGGFTYKF